jgi:hypothetical protein
MRDARLIGDPIAFEKELSSIPIAMTQKAPDAETTQKI